MPCWHQTLCIMMTSSSAPENSWRCSSAKTVTLVDWKCDTSMRALSSTSRKKCNSRRSNCSQHHVFSHHARNSGNSNCIQPITQTTAPASTLDGGRCYLPDVVSCMCVVAVAFGVPRCSRHSTPSVCARVILPQTPELPSDRPHQRWADPTPAPSQHA